MEHLAYIMCALTSLLCAVLLLRGYYRSNCKLLIWSALCFFGFFVENTLIFVDISLLPLIDLSLWHCLIAFVSVFIFLNAMIWENA